MKLHEAMLLGSSLCKLKAGNWNSCILGVAGSAAGIPEWGNFGRKRNIAIREIFPILFKTTNEYYEFHYTWVVGFDFQGDLIHTKGIQWVKMNIDKYIYDKFDDDVCAGKNTLESLIDYTKNLEFIYDDQKCLPLPITVSGVENHEFIEETVQA